MWLGLGLAMASVGAAAQTVTGSGTTNTLPVFTGASTVGNSPITVSGGNVGIGTPGPAAKLDVEGGPMTLLVSDGGAAGGFGTPIAEMFEASSTTNSVLDLITASGTYTGNMNYMYTNTNPTSAFNFLLMNAGSTTAFKVDGNGDVYAHGNVGIGTTSPGAALEVNGSGIKLTSGSGGVITFQDGTQQSTAFAPSLCSSTGADYAEAVDVTGDRTKYEPGDILVIDPDAPGKFLKSTQAYSTLVAGIYSTKPGFVGRKQPPTPETSVVEVPMAMVGRVPTKVSAENGPIKVGDLLVSSSTLGYAMKGTDRTLLTGAVVGKALGPLDSGTGVIEVLVTLQ
jgi:hypothetical protein